MNRTKRTPVKKKDYSLKFIGDDWVFLPKDEVQKKFQYDKLLYNIKRREKKIISDTEKLRVLKVQLSEMKKERTRQFNDLVKYHKTFVPRFTISMSKNKKSDGSGGNRSWDCEVRIGGMRKSIYLGTSIKTLELLDKIEDYTDYWIYKKPHIIGKYDDYDTVKKRLEELIIPIIRKEMMDELERSGSLVDWMDKKNKVDGKKYLECIYLNTPHYEPEMGKVKKESKGFFLGYNKDGIPFYKKRKKKENKSE